MQKKALVTGAAGFIGFHLSKRLLNDSWKVIGVDSMSDYYDVSLKHNRESILKKYTSYQSIHEKVEKPNLLMGVFEHERPDVVIHLAAQAGVRYSIEQPRSYLESNIIGTFELLEAARKYPPAHMLLASTSSVYGANEDMPYRETMKTDHQMSFYAATKKSTENIAHSYSHLFDLPITMCRFFTVYGPWGRPDMALFKFTKAVLENAKIDVYNQGNMSRDFTYIDDLINSIRLLIETSPHSQPTEINLLDTQDSKSAVAPFRVVNIGNSKPQKLLDFIYEIEKNTGRIALKNYLPMQPGDVQATYADTTLLDGLIGKRSTTSIQIGVKKFIDWYRHYYEI